jgi:8-oxo-dGTP pyrophosphatase MutT (NUDIX family)
MFIQQIKNYIPKCEQEEKDQIAIINFIERNPDCLNRSNLVAHLTSSAIVVNEKMTKVLFAYHNIYNSWSWVGGHNDGNPNFLEVAIEEAKEETGIKNVYPYSHDIFTIDVIYVENHQKKGVYVPDHLHLNLTFLLIADESDELTIKEDENSGVKWFNLDDVINHISEPRMKPIYQKAFNEIKNIQNKTKS